MSILFALISLISFISGFNQPLFKDSIKDRAAQIQTCANGGCQR